MNADPPAPCETRADAVWTYDEIADRARQTRDFFSERRIDIHRESALGVLLREAEALAREWNAGTNEGGINRLIAAAHANRIAEAIGAVRSDTGVDECLRRIAGNSVNLSDRAPSQGKDALWEIELLARLRRYLFDARFVDPPDIVIALDGAPYSVVCKKIYSERGAEAQVRKGIKQLKASGHPGIIALNLDDLVPAGTLLEASSLSQAHDFMHAFNVDFITRQQQRIQRYIADGRCDGVLVSTSVPSGIETVSPNFNNHNQTTLWTLNEASPAACARLRRFSVQMGATPGSVPMSWHGG